MMFSVITPVLNQSRPIRRCVASVRRCPVKTEHLVQDGGSTDGTREWVEVQPDLQMVSEPDGGMYDAINRGWARASGDILCWLNADEQYIASSLKLVADAFESHPDVDLVFGDTIIVGPNGRPLAARREIPLRKIYVANGMLYSLSCSLFFRRRLFDQGALRFDTSYRLAGDMDLVLRLLEHGVKTLHLGAYIGLFGVEGENQSIGRRMQEEMMRARRAHGGMPTRLLQRMVLLGRYAERWIRGCYRDDAVRYEWLDADGVPHAYACEKLGFRFTYERAVKQIQQEGLS